MPFRPSQVYEHAALTAQSAPRQPPKAVEELHQPLLLAVWFGLRLDCLQASTCALRIEGNDRLETRCHTEGIDSRPAFLPEFLQPARLALSFSATSIHQSHRATDGQPDQSRLLRTRRGFLFFGAGV